MVSTGVADAFGAVGGGVLAACLIPQLWKLGRTRSAADISLPFLLIYLLGLVVSFVYLYYEDAVVAWACLLVEIGCVLLMVSAKLYLDRWGPYSRRALRRPRPEAALTSSPSFADTVGLSIKDAGSAFAQLLQPEASHAAQHLLLEVRLALPAAQQPAQRHGITAGAGAAAEGRSAPRGQAPGREGSGRSSSGDDGGSNLKCETSMSGTGDAARDGDAGRAGGSDVLTAVAEMAAAALADAGMPALHRQAQTFPSFRQRPAAGDTDAAAEAGAAAAEAEAAAGPAPPHMLFLAFRGGYAAIIWHAASATLSFDLLATSDVAGARAAHAAQQLCERLLACWPGSRIDASSVARLLRQQAEQPLSSSGVAPVSWEGQSCT